MKKTHELIRDLREDNTLTQQELADYLEIGRTMYRRYETGETEIPIRHLKKLCILYKVSSDYFIGLNIGKLNQKGTIRMTRNEAVNDCKNVVREILAWAREQQFPAYDLIDILEQNLDEQLENVKKKL